MTRSGVAIWGVAAAAALLLSGCSPQLRDRGGNENATPDHIGDVDYVEVYRNADNFPNISRTCVQGRAFATTSSGARGDNNDADPALIRVPEWDSFCAEHQGSK
ncbi:hypothetical protein [Kribbella sp. NPDC055071]